MVEPERRIPLKSVASTRIAPASAQELTYRIELCDAGGEVTERVLARAHSSSLARTIFKAACQEFSEQCVVLSRGSRVIAKRIP